MKLSASLLGAVLVGITVQATTTSCVKQNNNLVKPKAQSEQNQTQNQNNNEQNPPQSGNPDACPACGMG